jgi:hypothetical protein
VKRQKYIYTGCTIYKSTPKKNYYGTEMNIIDPPNFPRDTVIHLTFFGRLLLSPVAQARAWCVTEQNVYLFSNITSHQNRLPLFVKHLSVLLLTRTYRIRFVTKVQGTGNFYNRQLVWCVTVLTGSAVFKKQQSE